jgi:replicative DNA helicase
VNEIQKELQEGIIASCLHGDEQYNLKKELFYQSYHSIINFINNGGTYKTARESDINVSRFNEIEAFYNIDEPLRSLEELHTIREIENLQLQSLSKIKKNIVDRVLLEKIQKKHDYLNGLKNKTNPNLYRGEDIIKIGKKVIESARSGKKNIKSTGIKALDEKINGLIDGAIMVIAGASGSGKTSFLLNLLSETIKNEQSLFYSLEMSPEQVMERLFSIRANVSYSKIIQGTVNISEAEAMEKVIYTDDFRKNLNIVTAFDFYRFEDCISKLGASTVYFDFIQMASGNNSDRFEKIGQIMRKVKDISDRRKTKFILLSQLNKANRSSNDATSLSGGGELENLPQVIMLIQREQPKKTKGKNTKGKNSDGNNDLESQNQSPIKKMILNIVKNRFGVAGKIELFFNGSRQRFYDEAGVDGNTPQNFIAKNGFITADNITVNADYKSENNFDSI